MKRDLVFALHAFFMAAILWGLIILGSPIFLLKRINKKWYYALMNTATGSKNQMQQKGENA